MNSTVFVRHACRLSGLVALVTALALGAPPAIAQTGVKEAQPQPAVAHLGPLELVKSSLSRVLAVVQSQSASATQAGKRRAEIRQAAVEMFDFDDMSRRILAQHWKDGSPQEQEEFVRLFTDLLERAYLTSIGNSPLASITFQGESINGSYAQVRSRMTGGRGGNAAIEYRLLESDGRWAVYDVAVDGISLISSYRSQFNSILRRHSFAELLERLQNREASVAPPGQAQGQ
ncbi:MAG: ABC transporter substrate-binding protein [Candidatus Rokubacteria bacterium]|nr:ABC transporter substrate-binding protein [Candidatus Rokubacteria bacterium]